MQNAFLIYAVCTKELLLTYSYAFTSCIAV